MKKLILILLALCLCLSVAACKSKDGGESKDSSVSSLSPNGSADKSADGSSASELSLDTEDDDSYGDATEATSSAPLISYEEISTDTMEIYASNTYSVYLQKNDDGTYTLTALIPENIESGKLVVSYSNKLSLVEGSVSTKLTGNAYVNEKYSRDGVEGVCVVFASTEAYEKGTVALSASFTAEEGATISANDISLPEWNLVSNGVRIGTHHDTVTTVKFISK